MKGTVYIMDVKIYAFSDEASPEIDRQIDALLRNGLNGMEIRNVDGVNVSSISAEKAREVKAKMDANGLSVWSIGSPIGKIGIRDDFDSHLEIFKHTLEIAEILSAKNIRFFSFFMPENENPEVFKDEVFERMGKFVETAKNLDVTLCHENEKEIYGDVPERCLEIFKAFPEIKGVFDPANFVQCGADTLKAWEMLKDYICYVHIKDAMEDGYVVPAGQGNGNIEKIAKDFVSRGGFAFTLEPHLAIFSGFEALERSGESINTRVSFSDNDTAFDFGCKSFKELMI